jgi:hypothetical protein
MMAGVSQYVHIPQKLKAKHQKDLKNMFLTFPFVFDSLNYVSWVEAIYY